MQPDPLPEYRSIRYQTTIDGLVAIHLALGDRSKGFKIGPLLHALKYGTFVGFAVTVILSIQGDYSFTFVAIAFGLTFLINLFTFRRTIESRLRSILSTEGYATDLPMAELRLEDDRAVYEQPRTTIRLPWDEAEDVDPQPDRLYIFGPATLVMSVPRSAFESDAAYQRFAAEAKRLKARAHNEPTPETPPLAR